MKKIVVGAVLFLLKMGQAYSQTSRAGKLQDMKPSGQTDHYTFQLRDKVVRQNVRFKTITELP